MRILILCLTFIALSSEAFACSLQGVYFNDTDDLITQSENIYLVEAYEKDVEINVTRGLETRQEIIPEIHFKIVEVLKGDRDDIAPVRIYHEDEWRQGLIGKDDFNQHRDPSFWTETGGRMAPFSYGQGLCGPQHTFYGGERYLLFPDQLLSMKSAELIKSDTDKWLAHVREQLTQNESP